MPDLKITQFSQIVTLDDTDVLAIVDLTDNTTKKVTVAQLKALAPVQSVNGATGAVTVQAVLVSGTNIKTINSNSLLGSGNIAVQEVLISGTNIKTINSTSLLGSGNIAVQAVLISGTNIKTINGNSILGSGDLTVTTPAAGSNGEIQYNNGGSSFGGALNLVWDDINNRLGVGTATPAKKLTVEDVANQCVALFESGVVGGGIAFMDISTANADQVGVGAFGDILCLRGEGNAAGTVQIGNAFVNVRGNQLRNFVPIINSEAVGLTIDSTNQDTYCAGVLEVTGAITVTIDDSVRDGFSISVIQMDANNCTFAASGTLTLQNRQGHTQTNGQWATVTLFKNGTNLILAGDTV